MDWQAELASDLSDNTEFDEEGLKLLGKVKPHNYFETWLTRCQGEYSKALEKFEASFESKKHSGVITNKNCIWFLRALAITEVILVK